jgi:hypothetical protein
MREFKVVDVCLGDVRIPDAAGLVFSYDTMKEMHGPTTEVGTWSAAGERQLKYDYDISKIRHPFKRFVTKRVPVVASQTMQQINDRCCVVDNQVRVRCFGAHLIRISASFKLERKGEPKRTYFSGEVRVNAALPFGLKRLTEAMLIENAEKEMRQYATHVQTKSAAAFKTIAQIFNTHPALFVQV